MVLSGNKEVAVVVRKMARKGLVWLGRPGCWQAEVCDSVGMTAEACQMKITDR